MPSDATPVPLCMVHVTCGSKERLINRSRLLHYKSAIRTVRAEFKIGKKVLDKAITLGVKCEVDKGSRFIVVSGASEWSGIARDMKHVLVNVETSNKGAHKVKREMKIKELKEEVDPISNRTIIVVSDSDTDSEPGNVSDDRSDVAEGDAMDVDDDDDDDGTETLVDDMVTRAQHKQVARDWLTAHPDAPWIVPPANLVEALRAHINKLARVSARGEKPRLPLPAIVLERLAPSGKKWLETQLAHTKISSDRKILGAGSKFYDVLVQAHRGSGNGHTNASTMSKNLGEKYVLSPRKSFYEMWVARCPECAQE
ncbi:unnamed protein product [Peniophora sp. CBMAI 1063]|nr:unnamed protein product [Peniophora sp. CBMAI 1063]